MSENYIAAELSVEDAIAHIGVLRKSGRYPFGSGENPNQRYREFVAYIDDLHKRGLSEADIAKGIGLAAGDEKYNTSILRAEKAIAKNAIKKDQESQALRLKDTGMSNVAIAKEMGLNESSVRALLNPALQARSDVLGLATDVLRRNVDEQGVIDIGTGVERHMDIGISRFNTAVAQLQTEGYQIQYPKVSQLGTGLDTTVKVLARADIAPKDIYADPSKIKNLDVFSQDRGRTYDKLVPPKNVDPKRISVRYGDEGGSDMDGVIQIRRGVDDISLGAAKYAQVRIAVDGTHYLKGMAMYADDLPAGVDIRFNTNKSNSGNKLDAMKPQKTDDPTNPFQSVVTQRYYTDAKGKKQLSAMNIVNEEGDWGKWSKSLSSQVLSKQPVSLAKEQLKLRYDQKQAEYEEIMALSNPSVRKRLLQSFSDDMDSSAVHLKAAALPRQSTKVILPITSLKENEIYAPTYKDGERVALIRYPHGGKFEIPELTVNNKSRDARAVLKQAIDAVGIHPKVAQRLSGADFDGDTVLVIPNNSGKLKSQPALAALKGFDPQTAYPRYEGMKVMSESYKQKAMGDVSNLITDMTIRGANDSEIARAVKHSMVVIDAAKHKLNYKQSAKDNGIAELKTKYQKGPRSGATTLVSQASSPVNVNNRNARRVSEGGPIDAKTGKKVYTPTGESYTNAKGETVFKTFKSAKMAETDDAFTLSSGKPIETAYAEHANKLKALGNTARKSMISTQLRPYSPTAKKAYQSEVNSLNAKLNVALKNAPLERQAQVLANAQVKQKTLANPGLDKAEIRKLNGIALTDSRNRVGAGKIRIEITDNEWAAIQAGAISNNRLDSILNNADLDQIKALATPRERTVMVPARMARAKALLNSGYTQAEVADQLGVPVSTINDALKEE